VRKLMQGRGAMYEANDPVELFVEARSRIEQAEAALPQLRALAQKEKQSISASYFEGIDGLQELYGNLLKKSAGKTCVGFFAHQRDTPKVLQEYWSVLNAQMIKEKISLRGITTKDETTEEYLEFKKMPKELLEIKALPATEYSSNISIEVYDDYTQIVSHRYMQGLLIQNPDIANVMRQILEIVWKEK